MGSINIIWDRTAKFVVNIEIDAICGLPRKNIHCSIAERDARNDVKMASAKWQNVVDRERAIPNLNR